jgi:hypothetical protein
MEGGIPMTENFTQAQGLIKVITSEGLLANPAGIEGFKVIVLEKVGNQGTRYYCTLEPGQTLRFAERLFTKYEALAVDVRYGRSFQISGQFSTRERGRKVTVRATMRYHVTDAGILALKSVDPLGELRDKVVAVLNRDLTQYPEAQINASLVEKIIRNVGPTPHLGMIIEDADVMEFSQDAGVTNATVQVDGVQQEINIQEMRDQANRSSQARNNDLDIKMRQARHDNIQLTDINVLMHEHPNLLPAIFQHFASRDQAITSAQLTLMAPVIQAYISQKSEEGAPIDPDELAKLIGRTMNVKPGLQGSMETPKQISWGSNPDVNLPPERPQVIFGDDKGKDNSVIENNSSKKGKPGKSDSAKDDRIKFGDV